jgi:arylsulfatase A-like enzyme
MKLKKTLVIALALVAMVAAGLYANRMLILQYSLGWHTDWKYPREPNHPVAWADGPTAADMPMAQRPPNVIVILADDLGINDVTTHGGGYAAQGVPTPNIDAIARDGVRFDQGYAAAAVCTVSRAALLTGRYPWRFGVEFTPTPGAMARVAGALYADPDRLYPVIIDQEKAKAAKDFNDLGMPPSEQTLAELLKARGYHTLHIGKWHLGSTPEMRPNGQGFDETLFMESGLHLPEKDPRVVNSKQDFDPIDKFLWPNMRFAVSYNGGKWFEPSKYLADYYTDEAVNAIRKNRNRPFFLYLAHWGVHTPLQASRDDYDALPQIKDHRQRVYAAMIRSVDRSVGRVMQTLREEGLDENTLVIFTSDNGAPGYIGLPEVNRPIAAGSSPSSRAVCGCPLSPNGRAHPAGYAVQACGVQHRHPAHRGPPPRAPPCRPIAHRRRQSAALPGQGGRGPGAARLVLARWPDAHGAGPGLEADVSPSGRRRTGCST